MLAMDLSWMCRGVRRDVYLFVGVCCNFADIHLLAMDMIDILYWVCRQMMAMMCQPT